MMATAGPRMPTNPAALQPSLGTNLPVETHNRIVYPLAGDQEFYTGEGTYRMRLEIRVAPPAPLPGDLPSPTGNPFYAVAGPPRAPARASAIQHHNDKGGSGPYSSKSAVEPRSVPVKLSKEVLDGSAVSRSSIETDEQSAESQDTSSEGTRVVGEHAAHDTNRLTSLGERLAALNIGSAAYKEASKRRKPKSNLSKGNSNFIARVMQPDIISKRLADRSSDGLFVFVNSRRSYQWLDLGSAKRPQDPLTKILFAKAVVRCHSINPTTRSATHLDLVIGFSTGDVLWYEPFSQRYARLNKNGYITSSPVGAVAWVPGSDHHLIAAHEDGSLTIYDKDKDETASESTDDIFDALSTDPKSGFSIKRSIRSKSSKSALIGWWKVGPATINDIAFSPDGKQLALACQDGYLRVIDYEHERLDDAYQSYYGGVTCVSWSHDGKYLASGGQDDLVSIWSASERKIMTRCRGHHSWITAVAFDAVRSDERNYRLGSVGEDCRLLLWDFSASTLHRPKLPGRIASMSSQGGARAAAGRLRTESIVNIALEEDVSNGRPIHSGEYLEHPMLPKAQIPVLPPVMCKVVDSDPLSGLAFFDDSILISTSTGHFQLWDRPMPDMDISSQITLAVKGAG